MKDQLLCLQPSKGELGKKAAQMSLFLARTGFSKQLFVFTRLHQVFPSTARSKKCFKNRPYCACAAAFARIQLLNQS